MQAAADRRDRVRAGLAAEPDASGSLAIRAGARGMIEDDPWRDLRRGLARILRGETPRTQAEWRTDYRILRWTTVISTGALMAALLLWIGWSDFR